VTNALAFHSAAFFTSVESFRFEAKSVNKINTPS
jgi:hypothetical protein